MFLMSKAAIAVLMGASPGTARASLVAYSSRNAWTAAVSGGQLYVFDAGFAPGNTNWGAGASLITNPSSDAVTVTLPGAVTAVGMDVFTVNPQATLQVILGGPPQPVATSANPTLAFIGFTSTTPITSMVFFATGTAVGMDNFSFRTAGTPEPESMSLVALALAAYVWRRSSTAGANR